MRLNQIFLPIAIIFFALHYSCKTIESSTQTAEMTPEDKQEILQTKVDTSSMMTLSADEVREITLMAQNAAKLYCRMKQFDGKDMKDIKVSKAYDPLDQEYRIIQNKANKLNTLGKMEYDRVFSESKAKCE